MSKVSQSPFFNLPFRPVGFVAAKRKATAPDLDRARTSLAWVAGVSPVSRVAPVAADGKIEQLADRDAFNAIATTGTGAGAAGMPEVKFLVDRQTQKVYFIPKEYPYHYEFAKQVLKYRGTEKQFLREAYRAPDRRYIAGTLNAFDNFEDGAGQKGIYGISFWVTDPVHANMILEAQKLIAQGMAFAAAKTVYHPLGRTQESLLDENGGAERQQLEAANLRIFTNAELSKKFSFMALNTGKSYGRLRFVDGANNAGEPLSRRDIAIYTGQVPADLPPIAGVATPQPQTFLSHVALKARQDHTPYAYARDIVNDPEVIALKGQLVSFEITNNGYVIKPASEADANAFFEKLRPEHEQILKPNLTVKTIKALDDIYFKDARAYGSKTANVAELHHLHVDGKFNRDRKADEPEVIAPDGFGTPARFYDDFFKKAKYDDHLTFAQRLEKMLGNPFFKKDLSKRKEMLLEFQDRMEKAEMPASLLGPLNTVLKKFKAKFPGMDVRIRSSSDSEDLVGFNGAGLFDSFSFRWKDADKPGRSFPDRMKKVFASVWNERAYAEFDFYKIRPSTVDMAELLMESTQGEIANGVVRWGGAIPGWDTITINAQTRDNLVTNPENGATPDAIVVGNYGFGGEAEIQYEAHTNLELVGERKSVLTDGEIHALYKAMGVIQAHFAKLYAEKSGKVDPNFSIECEFKITADGKLLIKQARPWVN